MLLCMRSGCAELAEENPPQNFFACFIIKVWGKQRKEKEFIAL